MNWTFLEKRGGRKGFQDEEAAADHTGDPHQTIRSIQLGAFSPERSLATNAGYGSASVS
jgi:hypothetical protein